jgi:hypothetical protein
MKSRFMLVTIALILFTSLIVAAETNKPGRVSANKNTTESVTPELTKIVVLCAADEKEKFEEAWRKYVSQNGLKGAKLKRTINWVGEEATIQRKKNRQMTGEEIDDQAWKAERKKLMDELARQVMLP